MITAELSPTAKVVNKNCATDNFGLGNKLFKIAAALGLAKKYNVKAVFPDLNHKNHKYFKETIFRNLDDNNGNKNFIRSEFKWYRSGYVDIPYKEGVNLRGDFQSWKFFENIENEIKDMFSIPEFLLSDIKNSEYGFLLNQKNVGLHVRRGDYVLNQDQYRLVGVEFAKKALNYFEKDTTCIVFSDDIAWCKKNLNFRDNIFFVEGKTEIFDFYFMTLLDDIIISNSTFSWWAAYLNKNKNKKVIAPKKWFEQKLKRIGYCADLELLPKDWITI